MEIHPLIKAFSDLANLNNFLLLHDKKDNTVSHIYPTTTMAGSYSRLTHIKDDEYEKMRSGNKHLVEVVGGQSIFDSELTEQNLLLVNEMANDINEKFFKNPVVDLTKCEILHASAERVDHILGDVYFKDEDGNIFQLTNGTLFLGPF